MKAGTATIEVKSQPKTYWFENGKVGFILLVLVFAKALFWF